ncbi:Ig-like domain-containing protein [Prauserella shujinwangii]|uniref:Ig-like domain-containing protein n=1 Tax=Prauserella shujinwangii TaxID=1453103 RepID=A0A2T0LXX3_9PSEU|nr:NBR1-Ig-like domain-containing protein [Prauserella shujinwangii]PRX48975.1 Ig-like domain-containing protein [Prauserella shujinwangii]
MTRGSGRRGRTATCPDESAGPVAAFARRLWELKRAAGDPSYDRMREEFGALASRSALSAAARGRHLPSWETTWEFVRVLAVGVLGEDEEATRSTWRRQWERARGAATGEGPVPVAAEPGTPRRGRGLTVAVTAAAAVVLLVAAGLVGSRLLGGSAPADESIDPSLAPLVPGDASEFGGDITVPDGTEVPTGSHFVKTWEFRNVGSVPWIGRYLRRAGSFGGPDECTSPERVPIPDTRPGESVRVSVEVRAPDRPGYCQVYWKMVDAEGRLVLPNHRAVFYLVRVVP